MKKYLFILMAVLFPINIHAASANIDISTSKADPGVNDNITVTANVNSSAPIGYYEYTLDYNHDMLRLVSGNSYNVEKANNSNTKSFKKEFKFKVISQGTSKIGAKSFAVTNTKENSLNVKVNPVTINAKASNKTSSNNNYLSSLEVEGYRINPSFNKNTLSYSLTIDDDVNEVNVIAKAEDSNATVNGAGKQTLKVGDNKIELVVVADNGDEKTYIVTIKLEKPKTVNLKVDGKDYTLISKLDSIKIPDTYKKDKIKIDDQEVEVLYSDKTKLTLVALKDEDGTTSLFIYDSKTNTYKPYNVIMTDNISFLPVVTDDSIEGYIKYTETINGVELNCYKTSEASNYCVVYGTNLKNDNEGWYVYDLEEGTIQSFNKDMENFYKEKINNTKILIYILSATTLVFGITTIVFVIKSTKRRK